MLARAHSYTVETGVPPDGVGAMHLTTVRSLHPPVPYVLRYNGQHTNYSIVSTNTTVYIYDEHP